MIKAIIARPMQMLRKIADQCSAMCRSIVSIVHPFCITTVRVGRGSSVGGTFGASLGGAAVNVGCGVRIASVIGGVAVAVACVIGADDACA